jgi:hypothetical protein
VISGEEDDPGAASGKSDALTNGGATVRDLFEASKTSWRLSERQLTSLRGFDPTGVDWLNASDYAFE